MPVAFGAVSTDVGTGTVITFSHTTSGSNRHLVVLWGTVGNVNVTSITFDGTALIEKVDFGTGFRIFMYEWDIGTNGEVPATTANVVVTLASSTGSAGGALSFTGVDQTTPTDAASTNSGGVGGTSDIVISSATDDMVVDVINAEDNAPDVGAGQTQRFSVPHADGGIASSTEPGAASVTMTWNNIPDIFNHGAFNINAAVAEVTIDIDKDGEYRVLLTDQDITKGATYRLQPSTDVVKSAAYRVQPTLDITKGAEYRIELIKDIGKSAQYRIVDTVDLIKSGEYRLLFAQDQDIVKSGQYSVQDTIDIIKSALYKILIADQDVTKSAVYRLLPTTDIAKAGVYAIKPPFDIDKSAQYALLNVDIDVTKSGDYKIVLVADIAKSGQYAVIAEVDVQKSGTYHVIIPPEITKSAQYNVLVEDIDKVLNATYRILFATDQDIVKSAEYRLKIQTDLAKSGVYSVITENDVVVTGAYKVIVENEIGLAGVYNIITAADIVKGGQYLILFATDVDIVKSGQYAVQPSTNLLVNGQYALQPTTDVSKFGQYRMGVEDIDVALFGQYRLLPTIDKALLGEYRILGQADPQKDLDLHCPLSEDLALELTLLEE